MNRLKSILLLCLFLLTSSTLLFAQESKEAKTDVAFLEKNASDLAKSMKRDKQRAFDMAKKKGWSTFQITRQGKIIQLVGVDESGLPLYEATDNETAAGTTRANKLYAGGGLGLNLNGSTMPNNSVAVWEAGGIILASHQEFAGGRIQLGDASTTTTSHATHVGGTIAASGVYGQARGMAYGLPNLLSFDTNSDNAEMSARAATGLLLSNHSYGVVAGWVRNSDQGNRWEFRGRWGENEDYRFGYYDTKARDWDNICFNAPYYLPVKSAGNYRNENGPAVGETYYRYNASNSMINAGARPAGISSNDGYGIVANYGTAKNILTVGAINGLKFGASSPSDIVYSAFTAWGPTDDGRIKPDLVADGVGVTSTNHTGNDHYYTSSGTSMAAPNATGTLTLLQELYYQQNAAFMRSATLKGLAIATTSEAGASPGPDYQYGWGLLNAEKAAKAILDNNTKSLISELNLTQGQTQTINVVASGNGPLMATISWTDRAGSVTSSSSSAALNNSTLRLVNDLDMRISDGTSTFSPWILDPENPSFAATTGDNFRDNVEQVYIANAVPGKSYTITINHKSTLTDGSQFFSLIVTGIGGTAYCASTPTSNVDSKITNFQLSNINHSPATDCTIYGDYTSQTAELEKSKTYTLSLTAGTCGINQNKIAKVFIDWNSDGDFDDIGELVATSAVIATNGTFTQAITVPSTVLADTYSRLRVVLTETSTASNVSACGSYAKGETQDYRVKFTEAAINVGVAEIVNPINGDAAGDTRTIVLKLKNYGAATVSGIPVNVLVKDGATTIANISETYNGSIPASGEVTYIVQTGFTAVQGKTYTIEARTNLSTDLIPGDNLVVKSVGFVAPPVLTSAKAYYTDIAGTHYLYAPQNDGVSFWYQSAAATNPFTNGNGVVTTTMPTSANTYYANLNAYAGNLGPVAKNTFGNGGSYGQAGFRLYFNTTAPMVIETARLYIGYRGAVTFNVFDANTGMKVSSSTISVANTRSPASATVGSADVISDGGRLHTLNINFPYAGSFYVTAEYNNGATLFRNALSSTSFVYPLTESTGLLSLVSHTGQSGTDMNYYYYFFYNIKAKPIGEKVETKVAVPLTNLTVTRQGDLLTSPIANGNQWYLNGSLINGATSATHQVNATGSYTVKVTLSGGVTITSQAFVVNTLPVTINSFTASKQANGVHLKWTTLSEINHKHFVVERSVEGNAFNEIGTVEPNTSKQYSFVDKFPNWGINYYRIVQVDRDGKTETFGPKVVNFDVATVSIQLYANPVKTNFTVKASDVRRDELYTITISDVLGKKAKELSVAGKELLSGKNIDATDLISGNYVIEIRCAQKIGQAKFVKL
ncbi:MAG: S8 family serine peptidase [Pedobacter sp.]|uniref:S8 family serine peptidase n=1 Tax=Pedobacter sp. TaxID=1411316 RepID=UPI0028092353|nr:S8 family serine peptidase [Pedobacter sp.]MDQ8004631.1 S8 family serine peptidase [Pedobacter sp.]